MLTKSIFTMLALSAVALTFGLTEASADVNVQISGYQPAPPGVIVLVDSGRPYYVEGEHRVYMEKRKPAKHHKKYKKQHDDNGNKYGHDKEKKHDH